MYSVLFPIQHFIVVLNGLHREIAGIGYFGFSGFTSFSSNDNNAMSCT